MANQTEQHEKRMRFAIYARYSSEMQNELSLEAQEYRCRQAIAERGGAVVSVYLDSARTGWSLDREGFNQMRVDAERGRFDAIMFWKFDRLARDHDQAVMIKMLLRNEYDLKLFCVEGFSEDDDNSPYTALMEQMLAVFSAFYSRNLSSETKRGKRQRVLKGEFNGSSAPFGYDLVTQEEARTRPPAGLNLNLRQAAIVRRAFRMYATGEYSDADIAMWMNQQPVVQRHRAGRMPMNKESVRHMLQNKVYTGRVCHADTQYNGSTLGQSRKASRKRKEWFEGKHQGFIADELFDLCQEVRSGMVQTRHTSGTMRTYILHDRVFCANCIAHKPDGLTDDNYGRMRPYHHTQNHKSYYRCIAHDRGYGSCGQPAVPVEQVDAQLVDILSHLVIPEGLRERVESAVRSRVENDLALTRMAEIQEIIQRIDFRWENGFVEKDEYIEKRRQLQREVDSLRPIDYDELNEAADILQHFRKYWDECAQFERPAEARRQLIGKIVDRVFLHSDRVIAVVISGNFAVILEEERTTPAEVAGAVDRALTTNGTTTLSSSWFGADGVRPVLCIVFSLFLPCRPLGLESSFHLLLFVRL